MTPPDDSDLAGWLSRARAREREQPAKVNEFLQQLGRERPHLAELTHLLAEKHRVALSERVVELEEAWHRRLSKRLLRAALILGVAAGALAIVQKATEPVLAISLFIAGLAAMYVVAQWSAIRGEHADRRDLEQARARYRAELSEP